MPQPLCCPYHSRATPSTRTSKDAKCANLFNPVWFLYIDISSSTGEVSGVVACHLPPVACQIPRSHRNNYDTRSLCPMLSNLRRLWCTRSTRTNQIHCSRMSSVSINTHSHTRVCLSTPCRGFRTLQMRYLWYRRAHAIKSVVCARFAQGCESVGPVKNNAQLCTPAPVTP